MMISDATMRAMETIVQREREVVDQTGFTVRAPKGSFLIAGRENAAPEYVTQATLSLRGGALVDDRGAAILGYDRPGSSPHALHVDPVDVALGFAGTMRVDADGTISYQREEIDPRSGLSEIVDETIGKLALARFPQSAPPPLTSAGRFASPAGVTPLTGTPGDGTFERITGASLDQQRIDTSFERLQDAYMAFDALRAAGKAHGSVEKTAMDLLK